MEKIFSKITGEKVCIVEHTLEQLNKWPDVKIYIGTDAQDYAPNTRFATCILYRYGTNGAHFIYYRQEVPMIRDIFTRLYTEGVRTIDTAILLTENISVAIEALEFDYADVKKTKSSPVVSALKGWVRGLGFNAQFKKGDKFSTKAADQVCRHTDIYK